MGKGMKELSVVVAASLNWGIGRNGTLPWDLRGDMKHFKHVTMHAAEGKRNAVVMGRKTYESIPEKHRPLRGRWNIVLTRNPDLQKSMPDGVQCCNSLDAAVSMCQDKSDVDNIVVIGGAECIQDALLHTDCKHIWLTRVHADVPCDTFMDPIDPEVFKENPAFSKVEQEEKGISYEIVLLTRQGPDQP